MNVRTEFRTEKESGKNGVICLVSMFPSLVMVLKLSKKVHFLQFCADLSKKTKFFKEIHIYDFTYRIYEFTYRLYIQNLPISC